MDPDPDPTNHFKFNDNHQYLEYNEVEMHSFLLVLLEINNIKPYRPALVTFEETKPPHNLQQFSKAQSLRNSNPLIFHLNQKIFICLCPSLIPKVVDEDDKIFFEFEEKLKEAIFEVL